jgi:hypothetical protein
MEKLQDLRQPAHGLPEPGDMRWSDMDDVGHDRDDLLHGRLRHFVGVCACQDRTILLESPFCIFSSLLLITMSAYCTYSSGFKMKTVHNYSAKLFGLVK